MHIANLPSSAFGLQNHRVEPAKAQRPPSLADSTGPNVASRPPAGGPNGPVAGPDPSRGSELLRRLDHGRLRDAGDRAPRPAGEVDHKRIHKALKRALKPIVKLLKEATRALMKEVGADKVERKAVRDLYKDFRTTVRDTIKHSRKSDIDDLVKVGAGIEEAFNTFIAGLKGVLGETPTHEDRPGGPATPDSSVGDSSVSRAPDTAPPDTAVDRPLDTSNKTADDTKNVPSRFDQLVSKLEGTFREGLGLLIDTISSVMSDPLQHDPGHDLDHDGDRDDDRHDNRGHDRDDDRHDNRGHDRDDDRGHDRHDNRGHDRDDDRGHDRHDDRGHDRDDDRGHDRHDNRGHDRDDDRGHDRDDDHGHHRRHGDRDGERGIDAYKGLVSSGFGRRIDRAA